MATHQNSNSFTPADEPAETRSRIKVAARRLFAERGVEAVTVREIVAAAGAKNGGSLNYYFKSKEGLITELLVDIFRDSNASWLDGLTKMEKAGGAGTVRDIVEVLVRTPDVKHLTDPSPTANRFLASVLFTRRKMMSEFLETMNYSVFNHLLKYIAKLRGDIPADVMRQRLIYFAWYNLSVRSAHEAYVSSRKRNAIWTDYDPMQNLIDTGVGLLEAQVTPAREIKQPKPAAKPAKKPTKRTA